MNDDRADEALGHLQVAAKEMIEAARAFLDVAEALVTDPRTAETVLGLIDSLAGVAGQARRNEPAPHPEPVEHIRVS